MVTANPTVVSPNSVPVQILTSNGQVVSQTMAVQQSPQQQQQQQHTTIVQHHHQVQAAQQQQTIVQPQTIVHQQVQQQQQQQQVQQQPQMHGQVMPKPKSHFCTHCHKGFATKNGLIQHTRRHPDGQCTVRAHACECGKAFFQKNHLMLHQRQHLDNKSAVQQVGDIESG